MRNGDYGLRKTWFDIKVGLLMLLAFLSVGIGLLLNTGVAFAQMPNPTNQSTAGKINNADVNSYWVSDSYAKSIPADATGNDPNHDNHPYIDEWMPDQGLQKIVVEMLSDPNNVVGLEQLNVKNPSDISKNILAKLTTIYNPATITDGPSEFFKPVMDMKTLEGLQYATNLKDLKIDTLAGTNMNNGKPGWYWSQLSDISALAPLQKLESVSFQMSSINDISALANKPSLLSVSFYADRVSDLSPLKTDPNVGTHLGRSNLLWQVIREPTIKINPNSQNQITTDQSVINQYGKTVDVYPYISTDTNSAVFNSKTNNFFVLHYSDAKNGEKVSTSKINWSQLQGSSGVLTSYFYDNPTEPNKFSSFNGIVVQPYIIDNTVAGAVTVHYQDTDGNQIADDVVLDNGKIGDHYTTTQKAIEGYTFKEVQGNATGEYTANPQTVTYVYTENPVKLNYTVKTVDKDGKDLGHGYAAKGKAGDVIKGKQ